MIGQGDGSLYVFACKRAVSIDKLTCGCPGSRPKIDGGVILLHSVFIIKTDTRKNNFDKFAPKEREGEGRERGREGMKDRERGGRERGRETEKKRERGEKCCIYKNSLRNVLTKLQAANRERLANTSEILNAPFVYSKLIRTK